MAVTLILQSLKRSRDKSLVYILPLSSHIQIDVIFNRGSTLSWQSLKRRRAIKAGQDNNKSDIE